VRPVTDRRAEREVTAQSKREVTAQSTRGRSLLRAQEGGHCSEHEREVTAVAVGARAVGEPHVVGELACSSVDARALVHQFGALFARLGWVGLITMLAMLGASCSSRYGAIVSLEEGCGAIDGVPIARVIEDEDGCPVSSEEMRWCTEIGALTEDIWCLVDESTGERYGNAVHGVLRPPLRHCREGEFTYECRR
jgi:hypothetical protein